MAKVFPDGWRELSAKRACCATNRRWWNSPSRCASPSCSLHHKIFGETDFAIVGARH
jgi:hypothetical protein